MSPEHSNGWSEYQKLVLFRLDELNTQVSELKKTTAQLVTSVAILKVKTGLIGAGAGMLSAAILKVVFR